MTYLLAALLFLLKALGVILATILALVLLLASLPVKARVTGSVSSRDLLEGILDDDATLELRLGRHGEESLGSSEAPVVPVDVDFDIQGAVLCGAAAVSMRGGEEPRLSLLGLGFRPRMKKAGSRKPGRVSQVSGDAGKDEPGDSVDRDAEAVGKTVSGNVDGDGIKKRWGSAAKPGLRFGRKLGSESGRKRGGARVSMKEIKRYLAPGVRRKTWDALRSVAASLHLRGSLDVACGFPEPGYTAMALAGYWTLGGPTNFKGVNFDAVFTEEVYDIRGSGEIWLVPVHLGWIVLRYMLSREIRPLWRKPKPRKTGANGSVEATSAD